STSGFLFPKTIAITMQVNGIKAPCDKVGAGCVSSLASLLSNLPEGSTLPFDIAITGSVNGSSPTVTGSSSAPWIKVGPQVLVPGNLSVTVDATSLTPNDYSGSVIIQCSGTLQCLPITVTVAITVVIGNRISGPGSIQFQGYIGRSNPAPQEFSLTTRD